MRNYSKVDEIKVANIDGQDVDATLVLEGGAFRGLYTAGVLDCLLDNNISINKAIGISAGGLNGTNYLAGCRGRTAYCVLKNRYNKRYVGLKAYHESGSIVGFKFMFEDLNKTLQLREDVLFSKTLYVGCCNTQTGNTEYFKVDNRKMLFDAVKASAAMPAVSKMVDINGSKYLDGGSNEKLPIRFAINNNFNKIIFIGTRPITYRRRPVSRITKLIRILYFKYPNFVKAIHDANGKYNRDIEYIQNLENEGKILTITPSKTIKVSRLEKNLEKLGNLYELGYEDCLKQLDEIKKYLDIN